MRVLLVDEDVPFLETLQSFLWDRGYEAEIATDVAECEIVLREFAPDVLILRTELAGDGRAGLLAQMLDDPALSGIPTILTTESHPLDVSGIPTDVPLAGWLSKPFSLSDLLAGISTAASFRAEQALSRQRNVVSEGAACHIPVASAALAAR